VGFDGQLAEGEAGTAVGHRHTRFSADTATEASTIRRVSTKSCFTRWRGIWPASSRNNPEPRSQIAAKNPESAREAV
jgi:hypothetical protein